MLDKLDFKGWSLLVEGAEGVIKHPQIRTMGDALSYGSSRLPSILRLLDLGLVKMHCEKITEEKLKEGRDIQAEELFTYKTTEFGLAVLEAYGRASGIPELPREFMESLDANVSNMSKSQVNDKQKDN